MIAAFGNAEWLESKWNWLENWMLGWCLEVWILISCMKSYIMNIARSKVYDSAIKNRIWAAVAVVKKRCVSTGFSKDTLKMQNYRHCLQEERNMFFSVPPEPYHYTPERRKKKTNEEGIFVPEKSGNSRLLFFSGKERPFKNGLVNDGKKRDLLEIFTHVFAIDRKKYGLVQTKKNCGTSTSEVLSQFISLYSRFVPGEFLQKIFLAKSSAG